MKKRLISIFLAFCLLLTLFPTALAWEVAPVETWEATPDTGSSETSAESEGTLLAGDIVASGECGDRGNNVTWTLDSEGTLIISGTGNMMSYNHTRAPWRNHQNEINTVLIQHSVTNIGDGAFFNCTGLKSVTISNRVISIGYDAFLDCKNLTSVIIPNSVTSIGENAFENCDNLTSVTIPSSVTSIGDSAFSWCDSLKTINVDDKNLYYSSEDGVLFNITKTKLCIFPAGRSNRYEIPNSVTSIENYAFCGCSRLTSVTIPNSVTLIGDHAFHDCDSLVSMTIPNSVTSIESYAFFGCDRLTNATIPNSVISIGESAFEGCGRLPSVTIPDSVTSIGDGAFSFCQSLKAINVDNKNLYYISEDGVLFNIAKTKLCIFPAGKSNYHEIPNSVTSIGGAAFAGCRRLTSLTIPNSVTSIGRQAFEFCHSLTSVAIPNGVTSIEEMTFDSCDGLTSVTIPNSVTSIGYATFRDCNGLKDVYYVGSETQWKEISINDDNAVLKAATIHYNSSGDIPADDFLFIMANFASEKTYDEDTGMWCREYVAVGNEYITTVMIKEGITLPCVKNGVGDSAVADGYNKACFSTIIGRDSQFNSDDILVSAYVYPSAYYARGIRRINSEEVRVNTSQSDNTTLLDVAENVRVYFVDGDEIEEIDYDEIVNDTQDYVFYILADGEITHLFICDDGGESQDSVGSPLPADWIFPTLRITRFVNPARSIDKPDYMIDGVPFYEIRVGHAIEKITLLFNVTDHTSYQVYRDADFSDGDALTLNLNVGDNLRYIELERIYLSAKDTAKDPRKETARYGVNIVRAADDGESDENALRNIPLVYTSSLAESGKKNVYLSATWGWNLFKENSRIFNNRLALASAVLSRAAEASEDNVKRALTSLGFSDFASDYYGDESAYLHPAYTFGHKCVSLDGVKRDVFAVVIRGTHGLEDVKTDLDSVKDGFHRAAENTFKPLTDYVNEHFESGILENSIFLVTGHSLGGAVANIIVHDLNAAYPSESVYGYTFATPKTDELLSLRHTVADHNLFNIINAEDWVPTRPLTWLYRYGNDIFYHRKQYNQKIYNIFNVITFGQELNEVMENFPSGDASYVDLMKYKYTHLMDNYLSYLLVKEENEAAWNYQIRSIYLCAPKARLFNGDTLGDTGTLPVNVDIYSSDGNELVGRISNGSIDSAITQNLPISVQGDGIRIYTSYDDYLIKINGSGNIDYSSEIIDYNTTEIVESKEYANVTLDSGDALQSAFGSSIQPDEVQLLTVDASGAFTGKIEMDGSTTDIATDAPTLSACDLAYESGQVSVTAVVDNFADKSVKGNLFAALYENGQFLDCVCLSECETPRGREIRRKLEFNHETAIRNAGNLKAKLFYVDSTTVQSLTPAAEIWHENKE